jgi:hypothetical protein
MRNTSVTLLLGMLLTIGLSSCGELPERGVVDRDIERNVEIDKDKDGRTVKPGMIDD